MKRFYHLGVDIACSGSFRIGKMNIMEKARKAMSPLLSIIPNFKISCKDSLNLFHSFIRPIVLYNSENLAQFTHHQIRAIEENKTSLIDYLTKSETNTVHQKFLKFVLGVKRNCSNMATLGELGEFPLHLYGLISLLSYWHRLTQMQEDTLVKQALNLVTNNGPDFSEWFATVKFLLKILNMEEYLPNPESITTKKFSHICSRKLQDLIVEQWKTNVLRESSHNVGILTNLDSIPSLKRNLKGSPILKMLMTSIYAKIYANFAAVITILKLKKADTKILVWRREYAKYAIQTLKLKCISWQYVHYLDHSENTILMSTMTTTS